MHRLRYLIGLATLVAAIASALWIVNVLQNADQRPGLPLRVEFRDARGLRAGADVRYRGVTVGTVRAVTIAGDGGKAVAWLQLDPLGAEQARVSSEFWIVTPRFAGLAGGVSGLDTLVRDAYVAFQTPAAGGSSLVAGSLLVGRERPAPSAEPEALDQIEHGDLLMSVLVPENHGLRPGSPVIFRGMQTGDVRSVELAPDGTHIELKLRIARRHRQTVTDRTEFWVARPALSGALLSGFTITDVSALLSPYVAYYGEPGKGVLVQDGYRVAAHASRPAIDVSEVPGEALRVEGATVLAPPDDVTLVRISYAAVERDTWSSDDPIQRQGSGLLFVDGAGRALVATARCLVDAAFTEQDSFGADPEIDDERINVLLPDGTVLRAGRIWVDGSGVDLAVLLLDGAPPDLRGTPATRMHFAGLVPGAAADLMVRRTGAGGETPPPTPMGPAAELAGHLGGVVSAGDLVIGIYCRQSARSTEPTVASLELLPGDLRPR